MRVANINCVLIVAKKMNKENDQQLPKINFSGLVIGTPEWNAVRAEVMTALNICGAFEAVYDPLDPKLRDQVFQKAITSFFDLPADVKSRSAGYRNNFYVPNVESVSIYEGNEEIIRSFTSLIWPQGNTHFCETMQKYAEVLKELEHMIRRMITEGLGLDCKYYDELIQKAHHALRASHYRSEMKEDHQDDHLYIAAHTDPLFVTIIGQDEADGLEVQIKGGQWIRPAPYCFVVLPGDSMEAWTNGRIQATRHRVTKNGSNNRRYVTLFTLRTAKGFLIQAPSELIDAAHPALYKPFDFNEYLQFALSEERIKAKTNTNRALKTFCGIENHG